MSLNHFSSDLPETLWWTQHPPVMESTTKTPPSSIHPEGLISQLYHRQLTTTSTRRQNTPFSFNLNQEDEEDLGDQVTDEREHISKQEESQQLEEIKKQPMFEKPLTPSDVGKLNRLVIPKQHAEKYFPLGGIRGGNSGEKGLLLSFVDESGKPWRFRYSYWNSSQSYVLTKGWSRFVKEKRLDAGDIVLFERHKADSDRFFIGWRRRTAIPVPADSLMAQPAVVAGGGRWTRMFYSGHPYPSAPNGPPLPYQPDHCLHAGLVVQNQTTPKTLRLFGVNLECQPDECDGPSQGQAHYHQSHSTAAHVSNYNNHMDFNSSRDMEATRRYQYQYQYQYHQG